MANRRPEPIRVLGSREHNLKNINLTLEKNRLICFTGVSGSGKSSLAFDTLYAEGQRRYVESLSSYARQFLGQLPKPDVDQISGLAPAISIQQKTGGWNPRSTVGTITQIHDYVRVLFARAGTQNCTHCGKPISAQTREHMIAQVLALPDGARFLLLAPKVRAQKGEYKDLFAELLQQGFIRARVDGQVIDLNDPPPLDRYRRHDIEVVVDRILIRRGVRPRVAEALETALSAGEGTAIVALLEAEEGRRPRRGRTETRDILLSAALACTDCGVSFEQPMPQMFSFNSPQGMCETCDGLGRKFDFDPALLIPDESLEFLAPCIAPFRHRVGRWRQHIYEGVAREVGFNLDAPWGGLPARAKKALLYGTADRHLTFEWKGRYGTWKHGGTFEGAIAELHARYKKSHSGMVRRFYEQYMREATCPRCGGARLNAQALSITLEGRVAGAARRLNIDQACKLSIDAALDFFSNLELQGVRNVIAHEPLKEICARLRFLTEVGLDYLTLDRPAPSLSGGESQRIRLASQIGCGLVGVLYVLDEPSIGLHQRDHRRLLTSLKRLRDMGNTVIVVEHDRDTMEAADEIVDFGPGPGVRGGEVVARGRLEDIAAQQRSVTGAYLSGRQQIEVPASRRPIRRPKRAAGRPAGA